MAYKQNFGPSRKSGKAMSMCGVSRVMSPLDAKDWIADATKNSKGQFKAKAEKAGMSTAAYANKVIKEDKGGKLEKQAHLAKTLMGLSRTESPLNKEPDFSNFVLQNNNDVQTGENSYSSPQRYDVDFGSFEGATISGSGSVSGGSDDVERDGNEGKGKLNRLDRKLKSAQEGQGNPAKEARLQGKIDREKIKSENKASRINSKNIDKKNKLTKKEFFKGQKFNEKQKKKGGATSSSHLFKKTSILKGEGIKKLTSSTPDISKLLKIK